MILKEDKTEPKTSQILDKVLGNSTPYGLFDCGAIVAGVSGGPDSVALLCILKSLKERNDINCGIYAFHCNHHLRPGVCDEEAEQVKQLCRDLGVDLKVIDFDCAGFAEINHVSEETAGRLLRYEAFEQYARALEEKTGSEVRIAVAHHKDDIAETMMMNLFRGSGLEGLVNPKIISGRIIRPLLCLKKSELTDYLDSKGIRYAVDQTNLTTQGTRNTWRNEFLPAIGRYYNDDPAVPLTRTYGFLADDLDYISKASGEAYLSAIKYLSGYPVLSVEKIRNLHPALRSRVIRLLWHETFGNLTDFEEVHMTGCTSLISHASTGEMTLDMSFGRKVFRHGDLFAFINADREEELAGKIAGDMGFFISGTPLNIEISLPDITSDGNYCIEIPDSALKLRAQIIENKGNIEYNNYSWFCPMDVIREGRLTLGNCSGTGTGFRMRRAGSAGSKEIIRLMTDLKIPASARKNIIFVGINGDILWLPGYGHGTGFTNAVSRERYIAGRSEGSKPEELIRFTIERR